MPLATTEREALRLLGVYSNGRFDIWALAGQSRASCRAHVMSTLNGEKTPQAQSGVTIMRQRFFAMAGSALSNSCEAVQQREFSAWAKQQIAELSTV